MPETDTRQDAKEATLPDPTREAQPPASGRTPGWIWAWALPLLIILLLYMARRVLGPFVIAGVIAYIFSMVIDNIQERLRWPRALIVSLLYALVLGVLGVGLYFGAEALFRQTREFIAGGPDILERGLKQIMGGATYQFGGQTLDAHFLAQQVNAGLRSYFGSGDALHFAGVLVELVLDTILVIIVSFYLLLDSNRVGSYMLKFVPEGSRARTGYVLGRIHTVLGAYLRGQLLLIIIMSVASFLVLQFIFQVPYALPLGILTGFLEIVPLIGPAIAAVIAAGVALSAQGAGAAIGVVVAYTILRLLEDQVVIPVVVGRAVNLHPVVTIFAVLAGGEIAGVLGMLLAVPIAAAIKVVLDILYPSDPEEALAQTRPGIKKAEREAEAGDKEPSLVGPAMGDGQA